MMADIEEEIEMYKRTYRRLSFFPPFSSHNITLDIVWHICLKGEP